MPAPRFSLVMTSYRSLRFLEQCLASVFAARGDFEFIFLDNGSPEPEAEFVRSRYGHDPRVQVFRGEETRYFAGGMNFVASKAKGEIIVLLSSDTRVEPDWLEVLDAYLERTGFEVAQTDLREPGKRLLGYNLDRMGLNMDLREGDLPPDGRVFVACGAALAFRREAWERLGGLDESFRMYFEDFDICWRANLFGYRVGVADGAIVHHVGGGSSRKGGFPWSLFRGVRNRGLCFVKNAGPRLLAPFLFYNALVRLVRAPVRVARGEFREAAAELAALASFFWLLPGALRERRRIQARRVVSDAELIRRGYFTSRMKYLRAGSKER